MSPVTLQWFPHPVSHTHTHLTLQHHPACLPVCPATAPASPPFTHIPLHSTHRSLPHPQGTAPKPLHSRTTSAHSHHSALDCPLIPTRLSSIRLLSGQKPAPATPGLFLVCQLPNDAWCAKHPARHHPHSPGRKRRGIKENIALAIIPEHGKDWIITQCNRNNKEKKPNHKNKTHHLYPSLKLAEFKAYNNFKITQTTVSSTLSFTLKKRPWGRVTFYES